MGVFGLKTKVLNIKKNYNSYKCYIVKNTRSYSLSEHPYCTQLTVTIPGGFPEASVTEEILTFCYFDKGWKEVETSKSCFSSVTQFLVHRHFTTVRIVRLTQFLNPTVRDILSILCLQDPALLLLGHPEVCVGPETREKMFPQGLQEKSEDVWRDQIQKQ